MKPFLFRLASSVFWIGFSIHTVAADTGRIRVEVVDPAGKPIPHLKIEASYHTKDQAPTFSLPPICGSAATDGQGKAEITLSRPANYISVSNAEWVARSEITEGQNAIRLTAVPFFITDFTTINQGRPPDAREAIKVGVIGNVKRPGYYVLPRNATVWVALEKAGGFATIDEESLINVHRALEREKSTVVFTLSWQRRAKETVPLLLSDGDIIGVDNGFDFIRDSIHLEQK